MKDIIRNLMDKETVLRKAIGMVENIPIVLTLETYQQGLMLCANRADETSGRLLIAVNTLTLANRAFNKLMKRYKFKEKT